MKNINLFIDNYFAWGIWQKIGLTGNREITLEEIDTFAKEVVKNAKEIGITVKSNFSRDMTYRFLDEYCDYISLKNGHCMKSLKLNDEISQEACLEIFHMCVLPNEIIKVLSDEKIGKTVFKQEKDISVNEECAL